MGNWKVPGWLWTLALALLPLLIQALQGEGLSAEPWAAGVVALLVMIVKLIQVYGPQPAGARSASRSKLRDLLIG